MPKYIDAIRLQGNCAQIKGPSLWLAPPTTGGPIPRLLTFIDSWVPFAWFQIGQIHVCHMVVSKRSLMIAFACMMGLVPMTSGAASSGSPVWYPCLEDLGTAGAQDLSADSVAAMHEVLGADHCKELPIDFRQEAEFAVSFLEAAYTADATNLQIPPRLDPLPEKGIVDEILELVGSAKIQTCPKTAHIGDVGIDIWTTATGPITINEMVGAGWAKVSAITNDAGHEVKIPAIHYSAAGSQVYGLAGSFRAGTIQVAGVPIPAAEFSADAGCGELLDIGPLEVGIVACTGSGAGELLDWPPLPGIPQPFQIVVWGSGESVLPCA